MSAATTLRILGIDPGLRAEALSVEDFVRLARLLDAGHKLDADA